MIWPVYEFRPLPEHFPHGSLRYADGKWIEDDGEYDIAFINLENYGAPICRYFDPPHRKNIVWSWLDGHWSSHEHRHPNANPWHYALRPGKAEWGQNWGHDNHPNYLAGRSGMTKLSSTRGCANGRSIELRAPGRIIAAGLVRERESGKILTLPHNAACMYCGDVWKPSEPATSD